MNAETKRHNTNVNCGEFAIINTLAIVYSLTAPTHRRCCRVLLAPTSEPLSPLLPDDCEALIASARSILNGLYRESGIPFRLHHCVLLRDSQDADKKIKDLLSGAGVAEHSFSGKKTKDWYDCDALTALEAVRALKEKKNSITLSTNPLPSQGTQKGTTDTILKKEISDNNNKKKRSSSGKPVHRTGHAAADALDWDEAISLIKSLYNDGHYTESMLLCSGCFLGLRISDLLELRWKDLCIEESITVVEKKTGKTRSLKVNPTLSTLARRCREKLSPESDDDYVFASWYKGREMHITRQRAWQMLKETAARYGVCSAKVFSTHSMRKTFGRRVWQNECRQGRGEQALLLLCDVFGHSNISITKRYLGIRRDEILSVYDSLNN